MVSRHRSRQMNSQVKNLSEESGTCAKKQDQDNRALTVLNSRNAKKMKLQEMNFWGESETD